MVINGPAAMAGSWLKRLSTKGTSDPTAAETITTASNETAMAMEVSQSPFQASMKASNLEGDGFRIDMMNATINVLSGCRLTQPGEPLDADQCSWNWSSNRVSAEGGVELKRESNQHITRSQRLEGVVGDQGTVTFSSPGGLVHSEMTIKDDRSRSGQGSRRPSSPVSF